MDNFLSFSNDFLTIFVSAVQDRTSIAIDNDKVPGIDRVRRNSYKKLNFHWEILILIELRHFVVKMGILLCGTVKIMGKF